MLKFTSNSYLYCPNIILLWTEVNCFLRAKNNVRSRLWRSDLRRQRCLQLSTRRFSHLPKEGFHPKHQLRPLSYEYRRISHCLKGVHQGKSLKIKLICWNGIYPQKTPHPNVLCNLKWRFRLCEHQRLRSLLFCPPSPWNGRLASKPQQTPISHQLAYQGLPCGHYEDHICEKDEHKEF